MIKDKQEKKSDKLKILITTGVSDPKGVSLVLLKWMKNVDTKNFDIVILVGKTFIHKEKLEKIKSHLPSSFKFYPFSYNYITDTDIAICTFGITTYELIYLGIPTISIGHAPINAIGSDILDKNYNVIMDLGFIDDLTEYKFLSSLNKLLDNEEIKKTLIEKCSGFIDGDGAKRVAYLLYNLAIKKQNTIIDEQIYDK